MSCRSIVREQRIHPAGPTEHELPDGPPTRVHTLTGTAHRLRGVIGLPGAAPGPDDGPCGALSAPDYSRLKHGDLPVIRRFGHRLAAALLRDHPVLAETAAEIALPVAYVTVPPACFFLARTVAEDLSAVRTDRGLPPARVVHLRKDAVTAADYAASPAASRGAELAAIGFELSEPVEGRVVVLVDDLRVTGTTEAAMLAALRGAAPAAVILGCVAVVEGDLRAEPQVESMLNTAQVRGILDMAECLERGDLMLTIRFLKECLKAPETALAQLLERCPDDLVQQMLDGALGSGPQLAAAHPRAVEQIAQEVHRRGGA